jgi:hypothetical protein
MIGIKIYLNELKMLKEEMLKIKIYKYLILLP